MSKDKTRKPKKSEKERDIKRSREPMENTTARQLRHRGHLCVQRGHDGKVTLDPDLSSHLTLRAKAILLTKPRLGQAVS